MTTQRPSRVETHGVLLCVSPRFAGFDDGSYYTNDVNVSNNVHGRGSQGRQDEKSYI